MLFFRLGCHEEVMCVHSLSRLFPSALALDQPRCPCTSSYTVWYNGYINADWCSCVPYDVFFLSEKHDSLRYVRGRRHMKNDQFRSVESHNDDTLISGRKPDALHGEAEKLFSRTKIPTPQEALG
jgi:hypothetical protein